MRNQNAVRRRRRHTRSRALKLGLPTFKKSMQRRHKERSKINLLMESLVTWEVQYVLY